MILINKTPLGLKLILITSMLVGCSITSNPTLMEAGLAGGALGAGSGALIGSVIKDGNVWKSAGLGALIGVPTSLAVSKYYTDYVEEKKLREEQQLIVDQQQEIFSNERKLERLRNQTFNDSSVELDESRRNVQFDGETLGSFYR
jgi:hypothetical protein